MAVDKIKNQCLPDRIPAKAPGHQNNVGNPKKALF